MTAPEERRYCRQCVDGSQYAEALALAREYAASLKPEVCVPADVYAQRLDACARCPHLAGDACRLCGCFVVVRAKKRGAGCPDAEEDRWPEILMETVNSF